MSIVYVSLQIVIGFQSVNNICKNEKNVDLHYWVCLSIVGRCVFCNIPFKVVICGKFKNLNKITKI